MRANPSAAQTIRAALGTVRRIADGDLSTESRVPKSSDGIGALIRHVDKLVAEFKLPPVAQKLAGYRLKAISAPVGAMSP